MKKFGFLTILALFSLVTLVMASCNNPSAPAPAEKVVNISDLPPLYKSGEVREFPSCSTTTYRWMSCSDSSMHYGTKFVPGAPKFVIAQGQMADLSKLLGMEGNKELVLRDKAKTSPAPTVTKPKPVAETPPAPVKEDDSDSLWSNIPWHWLGYLLLSGLGMAILYILLGLLRRLAHWMNAPLSRHSVQTHTNVTESVTEHHHEGGDNTRGAVVIRRAGDMVERTTTVTERFVVRGNHTNDRPNNGGRRYRD